MMTVRNTEKSLILNETTMTIHKQELGVGEFQSSCVRLDHVGREKLRIVGVSSVTGEQNASKCRQCFDEGGGY